MYKMWFNKSYYKKIKNLLTLTLLLISVNSCAVYPRFSPKQRGVDSEFTPYIQSYRMLIGQNKYSSKFKSLHINFSKLKEGILGRCYWLVNGEYEIEIDREWWYNYSNFYDKQFVTYHELEHCIRKRMHTNRKPEIEDVVDFWEEILYRMGIIPKIGSLYDGCPASIMHSHSLNLNCQLKHYMYYINEIKTLED